MDENEKIFKKVDNSSYRERFQFQLQVNENIICQRYFKIPHFNSNSLVSEELYDTLRQAVLMIKKDLVSKSRVYLANTFESMTKITGFVSKMKALAEAKENGASEDEIRNIVLRREADETNVYIEPKPWDENEFVQYGDVTFKFSFMVDDRAIYEEIWDGSQYPKYVRNSVDITNAKSHYPMVQLMNSGKTDIAVSIINSICEVCSNVDGETEQQYTKSFRDGNKKYSYSPYNRDYVNSWRVYCAKKYGNSNN